MQHISSSYLAAQQQINKQNSNGNLNVRMFWRQTFYFIFKEGKSEKD